MTSGLTRAGIKRAESGGERGFCANKRTRAMELGWGGGPPKQNDNLGDQLSSHRKKIRPGHIVKKRKEGEKS